MIDIAALDAGFARLAGEFEGRRAGAHAAVVRWEWYDGEAFDLRPLWYERNQQRRGRRLDQRPPLTQDHYRLGFDADGRVVATLEYSGFLNGQLYYETFRTYGADVTEEAHYYADGRPIYLAEHLLEAGRIRSSASAAIFGADVEEYDYVDGNVARIAVHHAQRKSGELLHLRPHTDIEATYDSEGLLRLTSTNAGQIAETLYERRRQRSS